MKKFKVVIALALVCLLAACAGPNTLADIPSPEGYIAGFWSGLVHGLIAPFSFFASLFTENITMYEVHNTGALYDLGFVLGAGILFGGSGSQT